MSRHAKPTLVRFFRGESENVANIEVDDWETADGWARFTIPFSNPNADRLFNEMFVAGPFRLIVMESAEVIWAMYQMETSTIISAYCVRCRSLVRQIRDTHPTDEWVVQNGGLSR